MSHIEKARASWGAALPAWVEALADRADLTSQNRAAAEIGYSSATVSYVIGNRYTGDLARVEERVRATILTEAVLCPRLDEIPLASCLEWREAAGRPFTAISSLHTEMRRACAACPRNGGSNA